MLSRIIKKPLVRTYLPLTEQTYISAVHPLRLFFAFLGFPPRNNYLEEEQNAFLFYFVQFLQDFSGFPPQENAPLWQKILTPVFFIWNVLTFLPKLAVNILAIFTEVLPDLGKVLFKRAANQAWNYALDKHKPTPLRILAGIGSYLAQFVSLAFSAASFIGHSITSPVKSIQRNWENNKLKAVLSGIQSVLMFVILSPLLLTFVPGLISSALPYLPQAVQSAVAAIVAGIKVVTELPVISSILNFLGQTIFASLINPNISAAMIGLLELAVLPVFAIGAGLTVAAQKFNNWYVGLREVPKVIFEEEPESVIIETSTARLSPRLTLKPEDGVENVVEENDELTAKKDDKAPAADSSLTTAPVIAPTAAVVPPPADENNDKDKTGDMGFAKKLS